MAGSLVDRTVVLAPRRLSAPPAKLLVLVALAFGLLFGAMACAAGLAVGVAHGAAEVSSPDADVMPRHADHSDSTGDPESEPMPPVDHGDHSGSSSTPGNHPGMACVVSVDLHFPEATAVAISDSSEITLLGLSAGCPADVDPPVPRFS